MENEQQYIDEIARLNAELQAKIAELATQKTAYDTQIAALQTAAATAAANAASALQAAREETAAANALLDLTKMQLAVEKLARKESLDKIESLAASLALATAEIARLRTKSYYICSKQLVFVMHAAPADMDFVEVRRPWVAEKVQQGVYVLRTGSDRDAAAALDGMGYVQQSF